MIICIIKLQDLRKSPSTSKEYEFHNLRDLHEFLLSNDNARNVINMSIQDQSKERDAKITMQRSQLFLKL